MPWKKTMRKFKRGRRRKPQPCAHCGRSKILISRRLCGRCQLRPDIKAQYPPVKSGGKPWNAREIRDAVADFQSGMSCPAVAAKIGRTTCSVKCMLEREGVGRYVRRTPEYYYKIIRRLHPKGWSDRRIAESAGCERSSITMYRNALGLPPNSSPRENGRQSYLSALARHDILPFHRRHQRDRLDAASAGWPPGTTGAVRRAFEALLSGPKDTVQLSSALDYGDDHAAYRLLAGMLANDWLKRVRGPRRLSVWSINWSVVDPNRQRARFAQ